MKWVQCGANRKNVMVYQRRIKYPRCIVGKKPHGVALEIFERFEVHAAEGWRENYAVKKEVRWPIWTRGSQRSNVLVLTKCFRGPSIQLRLFRPHPCGLHAPCYASSSRAPTSAEQSSSSCVESLWTSMGPKWNGLLSFMYQFAVVLWKSSFDLLITKSLFCLIQNSLSGTDKFESKTRRAECPSWEKRADGGKTLRTES